MHGSIDYAYFPPGLKPLSARPCEPSPELGVENAWLPVTSVHTMRTPLGIWFYFARGCSDFAWNAGRALLTRNRCDAALALQQLNATGIVGDSDSSRLEAAKRVAAWCCNDHACLNRNRNLPYGSHQRLLASAVSRASAWLGRPTNLEETLLECARGLYDTPRQCSDALLPNASLYGRSQNSSNATMVQPRAAALTVLAGADVLDFHNHALAHDLRRQGRGVDTIAMWQQPMGGGSIHWHAEIWDVRFVTERRPPQRNSFVSAGNYVHRSDVYGWPGAPRATSSHAGSPAAASRTDPASEQSARACTPRESFAACKACNQSRLQLHCHYWSWADTGSAEKHFKVRHERVGDHCREMRGNGSLSHLWPD